MFKSRTVLVVGAGASAEIGLPIGADLKRSIAEKLRITFPDNYRQATGDTEIYEAYRTKVARDNGMDINGYRVAGVQISEAMPLASSIDNYLETHAGDLRIELCGKLGIVRSILEAERRSAFFVERSDERGLDLSQTKIQSSWYVTFFRSLAESVPTKNIESLFSNLTFVVFNYDRCLELFLHRALQVYYKCSPDEANVLLSGVDFFHPYGTVGRLSWQTGDGPRADFGADVSGSSLLDLASGIRTFSERVASGDFLDRLRGRLSEADTVCYLGFSYHPSNMDILTVMEQSRIRRVYGTAFGVSDSDKKVVIRAVNRALKTTSKNASIDIPNLTCSGLFSEFSRSITQ